MTYRRCTLAVLALCLVSWNPLAAAGDELTLQGTIDRVDLEKSKFAVKVARGTHLLKLDKTSKAFIDGNEAKLQDLKPGQAVTVAYSSQSHVITRVDTFVTTKAPPTGGDKGTAEISTNGK